MAKEKELEAERRSASAVFKITQNLEHAANIVRANPTLAFHAKQEIIKVVQYFYKIINSEHRSRLLQEFISNTGVNSTGKERWSFIRMERSFWLLFFSAEGNYGETATFLEIIRLLSEPYVDNKGVDENFFEDFCPVDWGNLLSNSAVTPFRNQEFRFCVPKNIPEERWIRLNLPKSRLLTFIQIPESANEGKVIFCSVHGMCPRIRPRSWERQQDYEVPKAQALKFQLPPNACPGTRLRITTRSGREVIVEVPDDMTGGMMIHLVVPPSNDAPPEPLPKEFDESIEEEDEKSNNYTSSDDDSIKEHWALYSQSSSDLEEKDEELLQAKVKEEKRFRRDTVEQGSRRRSFIQKQIDILKNTPPHKLQWDSSYDSQNNIQNEDKRHLFRRWSSTRSNQEDIWRTPRAQTRRRLGSHSSSMKTTHHGDDVLRFTGLRSQCSQGATFRSRSASNSSFITSPPLTNTTSHQTIKELSAIRNWLETLAPSRGLGKYAKRLRSEGYETKAALLLLTENDVNEICCLNLKKMKYGNDVQLHRLLHPFQIETENVDDKNNVYAVISGETIKNEAKTVGRRLFRKSFDHSNNDLNCSATFASTSSHSKIFNEDTPVPPSLI